MAKPILRIGLHRNECSGSRKNIGIIQKMSNSCWSKFQRYHAGMRTCKIIWMDYSLWPSCFK